MGQAEGLEKEQFLHVEERLGDPSLGQNYNPGKRQKRQGSNRQHSLILQPSGAWLYSAPESNLQASDKPHV